MKIYRFSIALVAALGLIAGSLAEVASASSHPFAIAGPANVGLVVGHDAKLTYVVSDANGVVSTCGVGSNCYMLLSTTNADGTNVCSPVLFPVNPDGTVTYDHFTCNMAAWAVGTTVLTVSFPCTGIPTVSCNDPNEVVKATTITVHG